MVEKMETETEKLKAGRKCGKSMYVSTREMQSNGTECAGFVVVFVEDTPEIAELRKTSDKWRRAYNDVLRAYQNAKWAVRTARMAKAEEKAKAMGKNVRTD
jgi:hypothetical protein